MHESYTDDSLFNTVRKNALCIMPKDGIQSFGQLLVDEPCLKREFEELLVSLQTILLYSQQYSYKKICSRPNFFQANYR